MNFLQRIGITWFDKYHWHNYKSDGSIKWYKCTVCNKLKYKGLGF